MAYDNVIAYVCNTFFIIDVKVVCYYPDNRKLRHEKLYLYIVCGELCDSVCTIF